MSLPAPKTSEQYLTELIHRTVAATDQLTYFGDNGVARALLAATAPLGENGDLLATALLRRLTVMNATGADLVDAAAERGADQLPGRRARVAVIIEPFTLVASGFAHVSGSEDSISVDATGDFAVGMTIKIRNQDASVVESATINSIPVAGVLVVNTIFIDSYNAFVADVTAGNEVRVIAVVTVPEGTRVTTSVGATFETLTSVTTGTANPIMAGESSILALADKTWCECDEVGTVGNIDPLTVTGIDPAVAGVSRVYNPERGDYGSATEADADLRRRAIELPASGSQETASWIESVAMAAGLDVLRAVKDVSVGYGTLGVKALKANGAPLTTDELSALDTFLEARVRYPTDVTSSNITLTSFGVEARVTISPGYTLAEVWREAARRLATYLDWRLWDFGGTVDEAKLLSIVRETPGIASLETSSFIPAADTVMGATSLPVLAYLSLENIGVSPTVTINADLAVSF